MGKGKKKHSKEDALAEGVLDITALSVKKFRKVARQIAKLSAAQKVVGGLALVAVGLAYLAKQNLGADTAEADQPSTPTPSSPASQPALTLAAEASQVPAGKPNAPRKSRKSPRFKTED